MLLYSLVLFRFLFNWEQTSIARREGAREGKTALRQWGRWWWWRGDCRDWGISIMNVMNSIPHYPATMPTITSKTLFRSILQKISQLKKWWPFKTKIWLCQGEQKITLHETKYQQNKRNSIYFIKLCSSLQWMMLWGWIQKNENDLTIALWFNFNMLCLPL